jgi:mannose-1-phosphate guanylyltransferase
VGDNNFVVIMAGGAGTRFWPASTSSRPKQLLALTGTNQTMLQESLQRALNIVTPDRILIIANKEFADEVEYQCEYFFARGVQVIYEPSRRDTAAAAILGALHGESHFGPKSKMIVLTADHHITPKISTIEADVRLAVSEIQRDPSAILTFGIPPTFASTDYGYLKLSARDSHESIPLSAFTEKPVKEVAETLVSEGCLWNSGMFVWQVDEFLTLAQSCLPKHLELLRDPACLTPENYAKIPKISLDHGIITFAPNVRAIKAGFNWSDLGGFLAIEELLPKDDSGNAHNCLTTAFKSEDNLIYSLDGDDYVAVFGISNLVIVRAGKKTLVTTKEKLQDLKSLVDILPPQVKM